MSKPTDFKPYKRSWHTPIGGTLTAQVNATAAGNLIEHFVKLLPEGEDVGIDDIFMRIEALAAHTLAQLAKQDDGAKRDPDKMAALVIRTSSLIAENVARLAFNKLVSEGSLPPEFISTYELKHTDDEGPQHVERSH